MTYSHNSIPTEQNSPTRLRYQAAKTTVYSRGNALSALRWVLLLTPVALSAFLHYYTPEAGIWAALWAVTILTVDLVFLEPGADQLRKRGAQIQEAFDTEVLQLPWNSLLVSDHPPAEVIGAAAERHYRRAPNDSSLKDWYPPQVGQLPLAVARITCQRINTWWDASLRRVYSRFLTALLIIVAVAVLVYAISVSWTVERFLLVLIMPVFPTVVQILRAMLRHRETSDQSERQRSFAQQLWQDAINGEVEQAELEFRARQLQDAIYTRRRRSPWLPDYVFRLRRVSYDKDTRRVCEELIAEWGRCASQQAPGTGTVRASGG